jgi:dTDP-4-dehydrorhamnose reductase
MSEVACKGEAERRKAVVLGAAGLMGRAMVAELRRRGWQVVGLTRLDGDLSRTDWVRERLDQERPDWVVNAAACAQMEKCEEEPEATRAINVLLPWALADWAEEIGFEWVHFSSDYLFDGKKRDPYVETDPPAPLSEYGRQKWEADQRVLEVGEKRVVIARVAWLFGRGGKTFMSLMPELLRDREELTVATGRIGSCLHVEAGAEMIYRLMDQSGARGLFHLVHRGPVTWWEFAERCREWMMARGDPVKCGRIVPIPMEKMSSLTAVRPEYSVMDVSKVEGRVMEKMTSWEEGLRRFIEGRGTSGERARQAK